MPQQLNLYARSLCQSQQPNALGTLMLWQVAALAVVLAAGAVLQWHTRQVRDDTVQLLARADTRRDSLLQGNTSGPEQQQRAHLQRLRDREAALQRLQGLLANGSAGRREGYADYLESLARQAHPAVWITGLTLHGSDDAIEIRGRMTDPGALPDYLRSLQSEPRFKGRPFATLQIRRGGTDQTGLDPADFSEFTLSTSQSVRLQDSALLPGSSATPTPTPPAAPAVAQPAGTATASASKP